MSDNVAKSKDSMKEIFSYVMLIVGAMIAAFSIEEFLVPCTILDGGIVGISIMINNLTRIPLGALTLVLNLPFLIAGMRKLGKKFIAKSAVAMVTFSGSLEIFASLMVMTEDYLLAVCFGGVFLGIGVGLVIRSGGCPRAVIGIFNAVKPPAVFLRFFHSYKSHFRRVERRIYSYLGRRSVVGHHRCLVKSPYRRHALVRVQYAERSVNCFVVRDIWCFAFKKLAPKLLVGEIFLGERTPYQSEKLNRDRISK